MEKLLKGLLIVAEGRFLRTHDIETLGTLIGPHYPDLVDVVTKLAPLTIWNSAYRYPGSGGSAEPPPDPDKLSLILSEIAVIRHRLKPLIDAR
jgi:hypothetical protein